ncbi:butyrophilin subfamily 1 member A1-like isoform X1 [Alligator sinensis]|uniref:Butyrophilin subfamily 1 member A1-like isoform X1 n=1 Tax=Alligator sinensis TaxID=38654 RepID=A0A3Q0FVQ3_ALLSI|nr:butyrophilin subfamily 1 member A1-like isoform X1 [Alligator sinensis]
MKKKASSFQCFSVSMSLPRAIIFFMTFHICKPTSAQFKVIGPDQPVTAIVGQETVLPCHLSLNTSAENMEVRWFQYEPQTFVHLYHNGKDQYRQQMPEYRGRTELLKDGLMDGHVSLKILNTRPSDEGPYHCSVTDGISYAEAILELRVAGLGSAPQITFENYQDGGIRMVCRSAGWFPEPGVLWRDESGQNLTALSGTRSKREDGLFETEISIIIYEHSHRNLSCWIRNNLLNQIKESAVFISAFCFSDPFFPKVNPWMVALCVMLVVLFGFILLTVYLLKIKRDLQQKLEWRRIMSHPEKVILDPDTAHPYIILSEDGKVIGRGPRWQNWPDNPKRFTTLPCVLGSEGFTSGRHCWEVEVGDVGDLWALGVSRESVKRKEGIGRDADDGIWAVEQYLRKCRAMTTSKWVPLGQVPRRIWVVLDCDEAWVEFVNGDTDTLMYTFSQASFAGEKIYPWFWLEYITEEPQLRLCH